MLQILELKTENWEKLERKGETKLSVDQIFSKLHNALSFHIP